MAMEKYAIHDKPFNCDLCNKQYKQRSGLWRHKKKCNKSINLINKHTDTESLKLVMQTIISNLNSDNNMFNNKTKRIIDNTEG
jgi:ribosomal protein L37AE/L43A